ncbi:MAG: hypothetical protein K2K90_13405 [Lachnospiraceae bacterium]|nr:hypothetical protein [Lachnospiraceae bacterium]
MKNKLTRNWGLKIASFLSAAVLWLVVTNINDPIMTYRVTDVSVTIKNENLITDRGQVYEVLDGTDMLDVVTVSAPRSIIDSLDRSNIVAVADINDLTSVDTVPIRLSTNKYNDKLDSIRGNIDSVRLSIEEKKSRSLPVKSVTTGEVREGFMVGSISTDQNLIRISGPESVISQVSKAQAEVDISGFSNDVSTDSEVRLYDEDGQEITAENIDKSITKVRVSVEILERKELPLTCEVTGTPEDGYQLTGEVTFSKAVVTVAGKSKILENVETVAIPAGVLDVTGATEDVTALVDITKYLPDGVALAEDNFVGRVDVTAKIEAERDRAVRIPVGRIRFDGLPEGFRAVITEPANECSITFSGLPGVLNEVTAEEVTAVVDMEAWMAGEDMNEITEGSYWMPVTASVEGRDLRQNGVAEVRVHIIADE